MNEVDIRGWVRRQIREAAEGMDDRDGVYEWLDVVTVGHLIIERLCEPRCEGSAEVLALIHERRQAWQEVE